MVEIRTFNALRPKKEMIKEVNSPPYDVIDTDKAASIIKKNPYSFLKIIKPEATFPIQAKVSEEELIKRASVNLQEMISQQIMLSEKEPNFYIYQQDDCSHKRVGIVACLSVNDYKRGLIKNHEKIRLKAWEGRVAHIFGVSAHTGCALTIYRSTSMIEKIVNRCMIQENKIYSFISDDNVSNNCWRINQKDSIISLINAFKDIECVYIADGHHRVAAAVEVAEKKAKYAGNNLKDQEYLYFPSVLVPDTQINILGYHRLIKNIPGFSRENILEKLNSVFIIEKIIANKPFLPATKHEFGMNIADQWYKLSFKKDKMKTEVENTLDSLDVSILQDYVLSPILGINDPQKSKNIEFIGGKDSLVKIIEKMNQGANVAFTLYPTSVDEIIQISDNKTVMPPN